MSESSSRVIVFDAYGTLVQLTRRTRPEQTLMEWVRQQGLDPQSFPSSLIEGGQSWASWLHAHHLDPPPGLWDACLLAQQHEVLSTTLYPEAQPVVSHLLTQGYQVAVASNLSAYYAPFLNGFLDTLENIHGVTIPRAWSFVVHASKPNPSIFQHVAQHFPGRNAHQFLMVGDKLQEDVEGPRALGWKAVHLCRPKMNLWSALSQAGISTPSPFS